MKIRFYNAYVITFNDSFDIFENGQVCVDENKIVYVGKQCDNFVADREIDCCGDVLMPGFVVCDVNILAPVFNSCIFKENFENQLLEYDDVLKQKLTQEEIYFSTYHTIYSLIRSGVTCFKTSFNAEKGQIDAILSSGVKAVVGLILNDRLEENKRLINFEEKFKSCKKSNLVDFFVDVKPWNVVRNVCYCDCAKFFKKFGLKAITTASSTLNEVGECVKQFDLTPIKFLEKEGFFDAPSVVKNCIYVEKQDLQILQNFDVSVCVNVRETLGCGCGIFPLLSFLERDINVCLGAGNCALNFDVFSELCLLKSVVNGQLKQSNAVDDKTLLTLATKNGAKALGLENSVGELKNGFSADIIRISCKNFCDFSDMIYNIVNCARINDIVFTMINGKFVYENGNVCLPEKFETIREKNIATAKKIYKIFN